MKNFIEISDTLLTFFCEKLGMAHLPAVRADRRAERDAPYIAVGLRDYEGYINNGVHWAECTLEFTIYVGHDAGAGETLQVLKEQLESALESVALNELPDAKIIISYCDITQATDLSDSTAVSCEMLATVEFSSAFTTQI